MNTEKALFTENEIEEIIVDEIESLEEIICPSNGCSGMSSQCC